MKVKFTLTFILLFSHLSFSQTTDWRFGIEYNELQPSLGLPITTDDHDTLLSRLEYMTSSQTPHGGINVNGGGWRSMQSASGAAINFAVQDFWVQKFQQYGFEYLFNLVANAPWAVTNNADCVTQGSNDGCSPDTQHLQDWIDYVQACVERYDGDGFQDMPGLIQPVRFYIFSQEAFWNIEGTADSGEAAGQGFWDDNITHLISLHKITYDAIHAADPTGNTKLIGTGGVFWDLYSDFPDYPQIHGPTVQGRLTGNNLTGRTYTASWDSLTYLLQQLNDTVGGSKCDYIGWHPHMGWKSTDQSLKFLKTYCPGKPIFIDDMWSNMFTVYPFFPFNIRNGYTQFIPGDSLEGDFPNPTVSGFQQLLTGMDNNDTAVMNWFYAKASREAIKCFATTFGEGAERACFSMSNDISSYNPLYNLSWPYKYCGLTRQRDYNWEAKPTLYTMKTLIDKLFDFTSVTQLYTNVASDPKTRIYKFNRARGTSCYVAWSESGWKTITPQIPNGTTVTFSVLSDTLDYTHIITQQGIPSPTVSEVYSSGNQLTLQLGFEPVILEERTSSTASEEVSENNDITFQPNPFSKECLIIVSEGIKLENVQLVIYDSNGKKIKSVDIRSHRFILSGNGLNAGIYFYKLISNKKEDLWNGTLVVE